MINTNFTFTRTFGLIATVYVAFCSAAFAQQQDVEALLDQLRQAPPAEAQRLAAEITERWSASGSAAMDYLLMQGREALENNDPAAALVTLNALIDHAPDFAEGWHTRASAFYMARRLGEALADIERTLALNPNHFNSMVGLGLILEELGYTEEALEAFEASIALHPHQPNVQDAINRLRQETEGTAL